MSIKQNFSTIRPTLNLDFAGSQAVDSRITFTRASAATHTDSLGVLQTLRNNKPRIDFDATTGECRGLLIEEQRTNLFTGSSNINTTTWSQILEVNIIRNAITAPDGTQTAFKVSPNTVNYPHGVGQPFGPTNLATYTVSIYAKKGELDAFRTFAWYGGAWAAFNLTSGTVTSTAGGVTAAVSSVGNGWYRCSMTWVASGQDGIRFSIGDIYPNDNWIGNGTSGLYFWGPQVEAGTFATSYIPTTPTFVSRASSATYFDSTGILRTAPVNGARYGFGYDSTTQKWVSQGLVLEPAATNSCALGNTLGQFNFEGSGGCTIIRNNPSILNPQGVAGEVATVDNSAMTNSSFSDIIWYPSSTFQGLTKTLSMFVKGTSGQTVQLKLDRQGADGAYTQVTLTGEWQRISATYRFPSDNAAQATCRIGVRNLGSFTTGTAVIFHVWGAQLEDGSLTSYIPTYGATATRAADVSSSAATTRAQDTGTISGAAFKAFHNYNEYSLVFEMARIGQSSTDSTLWQIGNGTGNMQMYQYRDSGYINLYAATNNHSTNQAGANSSSQVLVTSVFSKFAGAVALNNYASVAAGSLGYTDTSALVPQDVDTFYLGSLSGHYKKITYYPIRLSNTQLQALTV